MNRNNIFSDKELLAIQTANHQKIQQETDRLRRIAESDAQLRQIMHFTFMSFLQIAKEYPGLASKCGVYPKPYRLRKYHFWEPSESQPLYSLGLGGIETQHKYKGEFGFEDCSATIFITPNGEFVIMALGRVWKFEIQLFKNNIDNYRSDVQYFRESQFWYSLRKLYRAEDNARLLEQDDIIANIKKHFQRLLTL